MDWLVLVFVILFALNIVASIGCSVITAKQENQKTVVLYCLYKELERYNNNTFVEEVGVKKC